MRMYPPRLPPTRHDRAVWRRGPGSSPRWCMSEKNYRFSSDTHAGTDCRSAVHPRHARDSWLDRARSALSNQLSATSWLQRHKPGDVPKCQHSGIRRASARRAKRRWSDSSLQVEDLKASGTPTSLASTCATFLGSATTMAGRSIMVCALCQRRSLASAQACSSDLPSSCAYSERYEERWSAVVDGIFSLEPQRIRLSGLGQSRECSSPRTHRGALAALWTLWSDASGHDRPILPTCGLF